MATISKFYLHDAATPNTGTMPGAGTAYAGSNDSSGDATNGRVAKAADDVIGSAQTSSLITALANTTAQNWGHRRFVSAPLAARTWTAADGIWTLSYARSESNTNHNGQIRCTISLWRPSSGAFVAGNATAFTTIIGTAMSSTSEVADSVSSSQVSPSFTSLDGDILVFEIFDHFTQGMSSAYTSSFFYDGTTEGSATSCASFVAPPIALTLYGAAAASLLAPGGRDGRRGALPMRIMRALAVDLDRKWARGEGGLLVPAV